MNEEQKLLYQINFYLKPTGAICNAEGNGLYRWIRIRDLDKKETIKRLKELHVYVSKELSDIFDIPGEMGRLRVVKGESELNENQKSRIH